MRHACCCAFFLISGLFFCLSFKVYADMGRIYATDAKVSEDSQKAIILHNLDEEVLILGTDLKSDKNTGIIRFIPFPSQPKIRLAESKVLESAANLIESHGLKFIHQTKGGVQSTQAVEIRFNQKIGAHDITTIKINEALGFRNWVNEFFKNKGLPQQKEYPDIESVVADYVKRGIVYFVFDFVEVTDKTLSVEPIEYRFTSKELYYPLKTSNTFGGQGGIDLILIIPGTICDPLYPDFYRMRATTSSPITVEELKNIFPEAGAFYGEKDIFIQLLRYQGKYEFADDIFYSLAQAAPQAIDLAIQNTQWENSLQEVTKAIDQRFPDKNLEFQKYAPEGALFSVLIPQGWTRKEYDFFKEYNQYEMMLYAPGHKGMSYLMAKIAYYGEEYRSPERFIYNLLNPKKEGSSLPLDIYAGGRKAKAIDMTTLRYPPIGIEDKPVTVIERYVVVPAEKGFYVLSYDAPADAAEANRWVFDKIVESFECTHGEKTAQKPLPEISGDEYRVYAGFFSSQNPPKTDPLQFAEAVDKSSYVYERTFIGKKLDSKNLKNLEKFFGKIDPGMLADYNKNNAREYQIKDMPELGDLTIYSQRQRDKAIRDSEIETDTSSLQPTAVTYLSRVGFNKKRDIALFYTSYASSPGTKYFVLMEKRDGKWVIKNAVLDDRIIF